ncbi:MAG: XdhC family protein [Thiotrichaceae bacterium]|nr:XdhC family protein [Thiotrichaceae bacterium]
MPKQSEFWAHCFHTIKAKHALALLLVVDSKGSSPGKKGAKMAIAPDGSRFGTIGGGQVEYNLSEQALVLLQQRESCSRLFYEQHNGSGQVCGGMQTVLYYQCTEANLTVLQDIQYAFQHKQAMQLCISPLSLVLNKAPTGGLKIEFNNNSDKGWLYQELIGSQKTAYIIGGGHVSLALSQALSLLDFEIIIIDQRQGVKTMEDNDYASKKKIIPYSEISKCVCEGKQVYVFIMTHSHFTDQQVLVELFNKQLAYLGILGSKRKIKVMQKNLIEDISDQRWQSIHAPMGLAIHSQTPMEIAISIAAELICEINQESRS